MNLAMTGASGLKGKVYTTLLVLAHHVNDEDNLGQCWPSRSAIAFRARQSIRTTTWALGELEKAGWITIEPQAGRRGCNRYTIDLGRMRTEAVRESPKRTPRKAAQRLPQPVQNSVEKLRIPCGRSVRKPVLKPRGRATVCTRTIKEELGIREVQGKTGAVTAGSVFPASPRPSLHRPLVDVRPLLQNLNRAASRDTRSRAPDPGLPPPCPAC